MGHDFAGALVDNLHGVFANLVDERVTRGSHLEKLCLIREGVGRDNISDVTTNLIKGFLLRSRPLAREQRVSNPGRSPGHNIPRLDQ